MHVRRALPALLLFAPLAAYVLYPLFALLAGSITEPLAPYRAEALGFDAAQQPVAAPLRALWGDAVAREALRGTLLVAAGSVLAGGVWGGALVLLWQRRDFPGRKWFALCGYAPLVLPPLVGTLAFHRLIGDGGWVWNVLPGAGGAAWLEGFGCVLLVHAYSFGVYTYAFGTAALVSSDPSREEAARSLGGGTWAVFRVAVWPVLRGPWIAAALLTFMAAAASYSAPMMLDNTGRYLTVEIARNPDDLGFQRALSVALALLAAAALPFFLQASRLGGGADVATGSGLKGSARTVDVPARGAERTVRLVLSVLAAGVLLAPLYAVLHGALEAPPAAGTNRFSAEDMAALLRSLLYGAAAAGVNVALAALLALGLRRAAVWAALPAEFAVMLALALPGSVVAIALLSAFNGPHPLAGGQALGGTAAILILAYVVRTLPLAVRPVRAALAGLEPELERAAANLGATPGRTLWRVVLPQLVPVLIAAGLVCFVTAAGEFVASQLLYDTSTRPAAVQIAEHARTDPHAAHGLALCLMALSATAITLANVLQRRAR